MNVQQANMSTWTKICVGECKRQGTELFPKAKGVQPNITSSVLLSYRLTETVLESVTGFELDSTHANFFMTNNTCG